MKKTLVLLAASMSLAFTACSPYQAIVKPDPRQDDIVISPELKDFLGNKPNPVVVLRVPYTTSVVTEEEQKTATKFNDAYNEMEKDLMKVGFTVRDRGLLNNLLSTGQADYMEIGRKIQTDLILEVQGIDFGIDNKLDRVIDKETGKMLRLQGCFVNAKYAKLECKIVIVEKGQTGAVLTLYGQTCSNGCNIEVSNDLSGVRLPGGQDWYPSFTFNPALNDEGMKEVIDYFSYKLAGILRGYGPMLGVRLRPVDEAAALKLGLLRPEGVWVQEILAGSSAEAAGVKAGDVILSVDGKDVNAVNELQALIAGHKPGDIVKLKIFRDGKTIAKDVTLSGHTQTDSSK